MNSKFGLAWMRLPAVTLAGLAFLEVNTQHADPEAKGLLGVIGRKLHQGDRLPRHGVKTHTHRLVALDHRRPIRQAESVGRYVQQILWAPLIETLRELESGPRCSAGGQPHCQTSWITGPRKETTVASSRFEIRYATLLKPLLMAMGMAPAQSGIEVTPEELRVQMGWAFRATIPICDVRHAKRSVPALILGWGVHGWAGRWLVNGSRKGVVQIEIDPAARGRVMGVPVRLATLLVSVVEPEKFIETVNRMGVARPP
jgi:hypothetical protein